MSSYFNTVCFLSSYSLWEEIDLIAKTNRAWIPGLTMVRIVNDTYTEQVHNPPRDQLMIHQCKGHSDFEASSRLIKFT